MNKGKNMEQKIKKRKKFNYYPNASIIILIMLLIIVSYDVVGRIYKKKGCCKNAKN